MDIDVTWTSVPNANIFIKFLPSGGAEDWTGNGTDEVYIGDVTITQTTADGAVSVYEDQVDSTYNKETSDFSASVNLYTSVSGNDTLTRLDDFEGVNNVLSLIHI